MKFLRKSVDEGGDFDSKKITLLPDSYDEKQPLIRTNSQILITGNPYDQPLAIQIFLLFCVSFTTFGSYFAHDSVSALEAPIKQELGLNSVQFGLLFSVYTFPNIIFVLIGGMITDRMGNRFSVLLFCGLCAVGSALVAGATNIRSWYVMLAGRFIFGIGAESSYAMGITLTVARLGSILAFTTISKVADVMGNFSYGLWFACLLSVFSFLMAVAFCILDKHFKRRVHFKETIDPTTPLLMDPRKLSRFYYMWVLIAVLIYSAIYPFQGMAGQFIAEKWDISFTHANNWLGFIGAIALVLSPPFGFLVDFTGKKGFLVVCGLSLAVVSFLLMGLTSLDPLPSIILLGIHFALMPAALWPCLPFIVEEKYSGFAFALVSCLMNASLTGTYTLAGDIVDKYGFTWFCLFFAYLSGASVLVALLWNVLDAFQKVPVLNQKVVSSKEEERARSAGYNKITDVEP